MVPSGDPSNSAGYQPTKLPTDARDERGWRVFDVPPVCRYGMKLVVNIDNKKLELVRQTQWMRVYVNPDIYGPDEWEVPPSSGNKWKIISPDAPQCPEVVGENAATGAGGSISPVVAGSTSPVVAGSTSPLFVAAGRKRDRDEEGEDEPWRLKKVKMLIQNRRVIERQLAEAGGGAALDDCVATTNALENWAKETADRQRLDPSSSSRAGVTPVVEREG